MAKLSRRRKAKYKGDIGMSKRMIIRNCPAYSGTRGVYWTCYEDNDKLLCQDCSNCVMKQIVEKCKRTCRMRCTNDCLDTKTHCGYGQILKLLDIQEVE